MCLLRRVDKLELAKGKAGIVFAEDAKVSHKDIRRLIEDYEGRITFRAPFTLKLSETHPRELIRVLRDIST